MRVACMCSCIIHKRITAQRRTRLAICCHFITWPFSFRKRYWLGPYTWMDLNCFRHSHEYLRPACKHSERKTTKTKTNSTQRLTPYINITQLVSPLCSINCSIVYHHRAALEHKRTRTHTHGPANSIIADCWQKRATQEFRLKLREKKVFLETARWLLYRYWILCQVVVVVNIASHVPVKFTRCTPTCPDLIELESARPTRMKKASLNRFKRNYEPYMRFILYSLALFDFFFAVFFDFRCIVVIASACGGFRCKFTRWLCRRVVFIIGARLRRASSSHKIFSSVCYIVSHIFLLCSFGRVFYRADRWMVRMRERIRAKMIWCVCCCSTLYSSVSYVYMYVWVGRWLVVVFFFSVKKGVQICSARTVVSIYTTPIK